MTRPELMYARRRRLVFLLLATVLAFTILGAVFVLATVRPAGVAPPTHAGPSRWPLPVRIYDGIAALPDGTVVIAEATDRPDSGNSLSVIGPQSSHAAVINIPQQPQCQRIYAMSPEALPDGRLGFLLVCQHAVTNDPPDTSSIVAFDRDRKTISTLAALDPYLVPNGQFAWDPEMSSAVMGIGGQTCRGLILVTSAGPGVLAQVVEGDGQSFRLSDTPDWTHGCKDTGQAEWPTWSADGRQIAFVASPASVGREGDARQESPWAIYVMDGLTGAPRRLIGGLRNPRSLHWSPDSKRLAFSGDVRGRGRGTWVFDPADGTLVKMADQRLDWLVWSPDGGSVIGSSIVNIDVDPLGMEILSIPIDTSDGSQTQGISSRARTKPMNRTARLRESGLVP